MAFKANDGSEFTNKPMASAHNARMAASKSKPSMHSEHAEHDEHDSVKCPHCGGKVELHPAAGDENAEPGEDQGGAMADGF